jgi:Ca-activated chloride channel family protein
MIALTFLRPWLLLALPLLLLLWMLARRAGRSGLQAFPHIAPHLRRHLTIGSEQTRRLRAPDLLVPAGMLMALAAAGPAWRPAPSPFVSETAPLVIALDLSPSMTATDVAPSRLERAEQKIRDLVALRAGGRVGLIAYAGSAHLIMPLTEDPTVLLPFLEGLDPSIMPRPGRRASDALALAERLLASEGTPGSVLFVTDGIDPADAFPPAASARAALIVAPSVPAEVAAWSRRASVAAVPVSVGDADLRAVQRALASRLARAGGAAGRQDDGWLLAVPAALLLLLWFRRGTTLRWPGTAAALAGLALLQPAPGRADGLADWFWTPDQQGARLYRDHRFADAAGAFADPAWRAAALFRAGRYAEAAELLEPFGTATAEYNRGTALVRGRDYAAAAAAFETALKLDPGNAAARANLDITNRIIALLTEAREQSNTEQTERPDGTVDDLTGEAGRRVRIDVGSQLSEDAAAEWMRQVETRPADFLKSRFAVEARAGPAS